MDDVAADVRLTADQEGTNTLWRIAMTGDAATAKPLALPNDPAAVMPALRYFRQSPPGFAARARDLAAEQEGRGEGQLLISPCGGDVRQDRGGQRREKTCQVFDISWSFSPHQLPPRARRSPAFRPYEGRDPHRLRRQGRGLGVADLRLAPKRTILALCPSLASAGALQKEAEKLGLVVSPADPRTSVSACPGAPACASGHIAARDLADEIANDFSGFFDGSFHLHVSGCAKGCAHPGEARADPGRRRERRWTLS